MLCVRHHSKLFPCIILSILTIAHAVGTCYCPLCADGGQYFTALTNLSSETCQVRATMSRARLFARCFYPCQWESIWFVDLVLTSAQRGNHARTKLPSVRWTVSLSQSTMASWGSGTARLSYSTGPGCCCFRATLDGGAGYVQVLANYNQITRGSLTPGEHSFTMWANCL